MNDTCKFYDIPCQLGWFQLEVKALFLFFYDSILSGLASVVEIIPVPDFLSSSESITLHETVSWALAPFSLDVGIGIIVSAYIGRFLIRRLPFIG
jgi:hypothetical protein